MLEEKVEYNMCSAYQYQFRLEACEQALAEERLEHHVSREALTFERERRKESDELIESGLDVVQQSCEIVLSLHAIVDDISQHSPQRVEQPSLRLELNLLKQQLDRVEGMMKPEIRSAEFGSPLTKVFEDTSALHRRLCEVLRSDIPSQSQAVPSQERESTITPTFELETNNGC
jgi:hypothetical protein